MDRGTRFSRPAPAAHVQAAIQGSSAAGLPVQPKARPRQVLAPHVQAAVQQPHRGAVAQRASSSSGKRDVRRHNVGIVVGYSTDTGRRVRDAFIDVGYTIDNWERAAARALTGTEWHYSTIAHGLGTSTSGTRGGTHEDIQACAEHLIRWAAQHPAPEKSKSKQHYGSHSSRKDPGKDRKDEDPGSSGGGSVGTGHLASWLTGVPAWYPHNTG